MHHNNPAQPAPGEPAPRTTAGLVLELASPGTGARKMMVVTASIFLLVLLTLILQALGSVLKPFFVALFLVYLIYPFAEFLHRRGVPKVLGFVVTVVVILMSLYGMVQLLVANVRNFFKHSVKYQARLAAWEEQIHDLGARTRLLALDEPFRFADVFSLLPQDSLARAVGGGTTFFLGLAGNLFVILIFIIFILLEVERMASRVELAFSEERAASVLQIMGDINRNVQRYIVIKVIFSALTATGSVIVMWLFGLDFFLLFGVIIFLFNFIPYVGSWAATLMPSAVALVQFESPLTALWLVLLLSVVQVIFGTFMEPRFHGRNLNLSPLLILLALAFWGWLWGVVGMILAIPIMVTLRIALEQVEATRPLSILMSNVGKRDVAQAEAHLAKLRARESEAQRSAIEAGEALDVSEATGVGRPPA